MKGRFIIEISPKISGCVEIHFSCVINTACWQEAAGGLTGCAHLRSPFLHMGSTSNSLSSNKSRLFIKDCHPSVLVTKYSLNYTVVHRHRIMFCHLMYMSLMSCYKIELAQKWDFLVL